MPKANTYPVYSPVTEDDFALGVRASNNTLVQIKIKTLNDFIGGGGGGGGGGTTAPALVPLIIGNVSSVAWTAQPAAAAEFNSGGTGRRLRRRANLSGYTLCRLSGYVVGAGSAGTVWAVEYTTDLSGASGWAALGDGGAAVQIPMDVVSTDAPATSTTVSIASAARTDVLLRVAGSGGNGSSSPSVASFLLELLP